MYRHGLHCTYYVGAGHCARTDRRSCNDTFNDTCNGASTCGV